MLHISHNHRTNTDVAFAIAPATPVMRAFICKKQSAPCQHTAPTKNDNSQNKGK